MKNTKAKTMRMMGYAAMAALTLAVGCAQDVGNIDRTQPELLHRSIFEGDWYVRQTIIDVPPTSGFSFVGLTGDMDIIRWDFQPDKVVGYRSYALISGTETDNDETYRGEPIVAYPATYVDVQRSYNPRTGEQSNVLEENTSDRPWYEREWVRIDWSSPQVPHYNFLSSQFDISPRSHVQQAQGGPDAFRAENADGVTWTRETMEDVGEVTYMDFTELVHATSVEGCIAQIYGELGDCAAGEIKIRTSLMKVDADREDQYEALFYDDRRQGEFGYFRTERPTYDRRRGVTWEGYLFLANRHDMWESAYREDGSLMPYGERQLRPIVYTLSADYPESLMEITEELAAEYDASFKNIAATRRGQSISELETDLLAQTGDTCLYCIDRNEEGTARLGDLRHNFIAWVDHPQMASPLGYGPSSANPLNGRIVAGMAYVYGASVDTYAQQAVDMVRLLNGDLDAEDLQAADFIRAEVAANRAPVDPRRMEALRAFAYDNPWDHRAFMGEGHMDRFDHLHEHGFPAARPGWERSQLERVRGTAFEPMLINDEMYQQLSEPVAPGSALTDEQMAELAPSNWATVDNFLAQRETRLRAERHSVWLSEFNDPSIVGLARAMKDSGLEGDALWQEMREQIYKAVMLHEIGHTVGLRHNFGASSDALNYHDEFWPLREEVELQGNTLADLLTFNCSVVDASNGPGCTAQENGRMREYQYSSIMDYGAKFNSDIQGLGRYDHAALASAYGDLVEVFDEEVTAGMGQSPLDTLRFFADDARNPLYGQLTDYVHYTDLPAMFGGIENLGRRRLMPREEYHAQLESGGNTVRVPYVACYDEFRDSTETCHTWDEGADPFEIVNNYVVSYRNYYTFNSFARDRVGFGSYDVFNRVLSRYFYPIQNMYQNWLFNYTGSGNLIDTYRLLGMYHGFSTLWNVMATPRYGSYRQNGDRYVWTSYTRGREDLDIEPGVGRRAFSVYDYEAGYGLFNRITEAGLFYEQYAAMVTLTNSQALGLGIGADVGADALSYSLPYYLVFQDEIDGLFGNVFNLNDVDYAPTVENGRIRQRDLMDFALGFDDSEAEGIVALNPSWSTRIQSMLFGSALLSSNYDLSFVQKMQVSLVGSGEEITPADGFDAVTLNDPSSGRIYVTYRPTGETSSDWSAAHRIDEINELVTEWQGMDDGQEKDSMLNTIRNEVEDLEILRGLYNLYGQAF